MSSSESYQANHDDDRGMQECIQSHEEQAFYSAVMEVKGFIDSGAVSFEQVERILRGDDNVRSTQ